MEAQAPIKEPVRPYRRFALAGLAALLIGGAAGWTAGRFYRHARQGQRVVETRGSGYRFVSPLLECEMSGSDLMELRVFKRDIARVVSEEIGRRHIKLASVYFRDLNNGPWVGINHDEKFAPASLLKVPLMMSYLKWAESAPGVLRRPLCFQRRAELAEQEFQPSRPLLPGRCYSVDELIEHMILDSDNDARNLLYANLPHERAEASYKDLGLQVPSASGDSMTVQEYASFFRILYNASYLSRAMSEKALNLLAKAEFRTGLRGGLPRDIPLAHKFGDRTVGGVKQLHDCGIAYYPSHPYLLCVMSRGADYSDMDDVISKVSRVVYEQAARQFPRIP